jgi:hypothetical protein
LSRIGKMGSATRFALTCGLALGLTACSTVSYPSLARRAAEGRQTETAKASVAHTAPNPQARLAQWLDAAHKAQDNFTHTLPNTQALLARSGARGGEAWSQANLALAELERHRAALGDVVADMEQAYAKDRIEQTVSAPAEADWAKTRAEILRMAADQDRQLAELRAKLR